MGKEIAIGIHAVVDWECIWDQELFTALVRNYDISEEELAPPDKICSERDLLRAVLYYMSKSQGAELLAETNDIIESFGSRFAYKTTIGGTAARAAIALAKVGIPSILQITTDNETIRRLLPDSIEVVPADPKAESRLYPHVSVTYPGGVRIRTEKLDFTTTRENRILMCSDPLIFEMPVREDFYTRCQDAKVFLESCFSEIKDEDILRDRVEKCRRMLAGLREQTLVIFEDAHYPRQAFRRYVNDRLHPYLDVISMNEDELQDQAGREINLTDVKDVLAALEQIYQEMRVPTVFVHSSLWAVAYGRNHDRYRTALENGIAMAATRFCYGDSFGIDEFHHVRKLACCSAGESFAEEIEKTGEPVTCVACKDLSFVKTPTVVGLGDAFAGGLLTAFVSFS